jgi:hypothetical protein
MSTSLLRLPILLVAAAVGCRSSAERTWLEMQSVYRNAKAVDEQLKAGADLNELRRLEGNLGTELAFVDDRMRSDPSVDKLLSRHYAAYQSVLQSYTLVTDIIEYHSASEQCIGPRHEPVDKAHRKLMSSDELMADVLAEGDFLNRVVKCVQRDRGLDQSLHKRADLLGMDCPKFEWDSGCLVGFAEIKLADAENLVLGTQAAPSHSR